MSMLLDLVEVAKSHSGTNLAVAFVKVLEEFGIEDKVSSALHNQILVDLLHILSSQILSVTCDNASNNETMVDHLLTLVEIFPGAANQTWCFTHILNLVAKSILRSFAKKKVAEGDVDDGTDVLDDNDEEELYFGDDEDGLGDQRDGMSEEEVDELDNTVVPVQLMLTKVSHFKLSLVLSNPNSSLELSQTQSKIHQQLSSLSGLKSLRTLASMLV